MLFVAAHVRFCLGVPSYRLMTEIQGKSTRQTIRCPEEMGLVETGRPALSDSALARGGPSLRNRLAYHRSRGVVRAVVIEVETSTPAPSGSPYFAAAVCSSYPIFSRPIAGNK